MPVMAKQLIRTKCQACEKEFEIDEWWYNYRLKRNNGRGVFCSVECGQKDKKISKEQKEKISLSIRKAIDEGRKKISKIIKTNCSSCGIELEMEEWYYNARMKRSKRDQIFCSTGCVQKGRIWSEDSKKKISDKQTGVSVLTRGRKGHIVSEETKEKIRSVKKGKNGIVPDWKIVTTEMQRRGINKYVMTTRPVPDAIWVEDGKLIALELEKKPWLTAVKEKMDLYKLGTNYDKVYLVWYNLKGTRQKEWLFENGHWIES